MSATEETVITAPVPPATDTPPKAAEGETPPAADATQPRAENGRFHNPVQPRIDELTRKVRENEREAAYWRARAEANTAPAPKPAEKPTPDKFDDYGAYVEALTDWKAEEKVNATLDKREKATAEKQTAEKRQTSWQQQLETARKTIPDIDAQLAASTLPVAPHVSELLLESDIGPQVAVHLDKHPELAEKLNAMTPTQAAREIGKLEVSLTTVSPTPDPEVDAPQTPAVQPKTRTTQAPPPVKPVGQGRSTTVDLSKVSMDDYVKQRAAQGATWAR